MLHYIRDISLDGQATYDAGMPQWNYVLFHFLRTAGWEWLWECDGILDDPNHCPDGDMEVAGDASWADVAGGVAVKSTGTVHSLIQSLTLTTSLTGDGVQSASLTGMSDLTTYRIALWANNGTGVTHDVLVDTGSGAPASVGTIPNNSGVWTRYDFTFTTNAAGTRFIQILALADGASGPIYVDDINVFRSWYEYNGLDQSGSDGDVQNNNEFSSAGYTFLAGDIGKVVCFWDPVNLGNSGAYKITGINAGNAVLDLRVGGVETLTNTVVGTLAWRLIDWILAPNESSTSDQGAGYGLESPHSSSWRYFSRQHMRPTAATNNIEMWAAATDVDFSVLNGVFTADGPSQFNNDLSDSLKTPYSYNDYGGFMTTGAGGGSGYTHSRMSCMVSDDGSMIALYHRTLPTATQVGYFVVGFSGDDARHSGQETFSIFVNEPVGNGAKNECDPDDTIATTYGHTALVGTAADRMVGAHTGRYLSEAGFTEELTHAKANPFSSEEALITQPILRDWEGSAGFYSEKEWTEETALFLCRSNLPVFQTFDNGNYLHLTGGICWKWMGVTISP